MIHSELCSACSGPLQLGVGIVLLFYYTTVAVPAQVDGSAAEKRTAQ